MIVNNSDTSLGHNEKIVLVDGRKGSKNFAVCNCRLKRERRNYPIGGGIEATSEVYTAQVYSIENDWEYNGSIDTLVYMYHPGTGKRLTIKEFRHYDVAGPLAKTFPLFKVVAIEEVK